MNISNRRYRLGWGVVMLLAMWTVGAPTSAIAAELVVYGSKDCPISQNFRRDVAAHYRTTKAGGTFPLREVDIEKGSAGIILTQPVTKTPTFVFVDKGIEIARFTGYPGRTHFLRLTDGAADAFLKDKGPR